MAVNDDLSVIVVKRGKVLWLSAEIVFFLVVFADFEHERISIRLSQGDNFCWTKMRLRALKDNSEELKELIIVKKLSEELKKS